MLLRRPFRPFSSEICLLALAMRLLKCGQELALKRKELCMVAMAGCMRGTIAYALILRAVPSEDNQTHVDRIMALWPST